MATAKIRYNDKGAYCLLADRPKVEPKLPDLTERNPQRLWNLTEQDKEHKAIRAKYRKVVNSKRGKRLLAERETWLADSSAWSFEDLASEPDKHYGELVEESARALARQTGIKQGVLANIFGYFLHKSPYGERKDLCQLFAEVLIKASHVDSPNHAFTLIRGRWIDWYRAYRLRQHYSIDADNRLAIESAQHEIAEAKLKEQFVESHESHLLRSEFEALTIETLAATERAEAKLERRQWANEVEQALGYVESEAAQIEGKLDARRIWAKLPKDIRPIVNKRLAGNRLDCAERQRLSRWLKNGGKAKIEAVTLIKA